MALPLLLGAHHGLMVGGAHHDAVLVGEAGILGVVLVERVGPHGGPEVVGAHPQHELEYPRVELVVEPAELLPGPAGELGGLVVEEDSPVLDRGLALHPADGRHVKRVAAARRDVPPPVPRRDADLLGHLVDAVDRPPLVAAGDDKGPGHAGDRVVHDLDEEGLPFAADRHGVDLAARNEAVDERAAAERAEDDRVGTGRRLVRREGGPQPGDALDVGLEVMGRPKDARPVAVRGPDRGGCARVRQDDGAGRGRIAHNRRVAQRRARARSREEQHGENQDGIQPAMPAEAPVGRRGHVPTNVSGSRRGASRKWPAPGRPSLPSPRFARIPPW